MTIVGGRRLRFIRDSFRFMVRDSLGDLGWFDSGRQHKDVTIIFDQVDYQTEVIPNTIAICDDDLLSLDEEVGSDLAEHRWSFYIDVYAESSDLGIHLANDIKAIVEGRLPSIGRSGRVFPVYDYSQATPPVIFNCEIEGVFLSKGQVYNKPWERHWYSLGLTIVDYYGDEDDS